MIREGKRKQYEEEEVLKASEGLSFSHVKIGSDTKKKKKLSKKQALELAKKKMEEVKQDPEKGKKYLWEVAISKAAGIKVHDHPKLIKKSIKKENKKHEKNVEKWKERIESRDKVRMEKQQKRFGNITDRIHDKKMRRIAKREKKLLRRGSEVHREGFITKS